MPHALRPRLIPLLAVAAALILLGAGCKDAPVPAPNPPPEARFDVTKTTCPEIAAAREKVAAAYAASVRAASDTYLEARRLFQADLDACLNGIWKGGPCDTEYEETQRAYQNASNDISNDQFYKEWKKAKADWDACYGNYAAKQQDWIARNQNKDKSCQEEFTAKVDAADQAYQSAAKAAHDKRDADDAFLDELDKKCKSSAGSGLDLTVPNGATKDLPVKADLGGATTPGVRTVTPPAGTTYRPQSPACQDEVPGENGAVRQGKASDYGPRDILVDLITTVAEDITGSPVPTGAINDQIFATMVVTKIRTRIAEMDRDSIDHLDDNRWQRRYEQQRARYERALSVWGAIAQGKPALPKIKKDVNAINAMPSGACKTDADCGQPICCSASEIAHWTCDTGTGACHHQKEPCENPTTCAGKPAQCVAPPVKVRAILFNGKYLPLDQLMIENEKGCGADHYHAKQGMVRATDGSFVSDPGPQCGYGKVKDRPTVEVEVPSMRIDTNATIEIRRGR